MINSTHNSGSCVEIELNFPQTSYRSKYTLVILVSSSHDFTNLLFLYMPYWLAFLSV